MICRKNQVTRSPTAPAREAGGDPEAKWETDPATTYSPWRFMLKRQVIANVYSKLFARAAARLPPAKGDRALLKTDLWVDGLGADVAAEANTAFAAYGIDVSAAVCTAAKRRMKRAPLEGIVRADVRQLPFRSGRFDMVSDISTLDHVRPSEAFGAVREYARALKPGGSLLLCVDSKLSLPWMAYRKTLPYPVWSWLPSALRAAVEAAKLKVAFSGFTNAPLDLPGSPLWRLGCSRLTSLLAPLAQYCVIVADRECNAARAD